MLFKKRLLNISMPMIIQNDEAAGSTDLIVVPVNIIITLMLEIIFYIFTTY